MSKASEPCRRRVASAVFGGRRAAGGEAPALLARPAQPQCAQLTLAAGRPAAASASADPGPRLLGDRLRDGSRNFPWLNLVSLFAPDHSVYNSTESVNTHVRSLLNSCARFMVFDPTAQRLFDTEPKLAPIKGLVDVVRLTAVNANHSSSANKTRILLNFGIHGREYISSEVGLRLLYTLCDGSPSSLELLEHTEFMVIPVANPVGRKKVESEASCSSQRKNGNEVDLNRNFDFEWGKGFPDTSAEDYHGAAPESEAEVLLLTKLAKEWSPRVFIDVHSGDETLVYPYSYKEEACADGDAHKALLEYVNTETGGLDGKPVRMGPAALALDPPYTAAGTSIDYMYAKAGVEFAYTWEVHAGMRPPLANFLVAKGAHAGEASAAASSGASAKESARLSSRQLQLLQAAEPGRLSAVVPRAVPLDGDGAPIRRPATLTLRRPHDAAAAAPPARADGGGRRLAGGARPAAPLAAAAAQLRCRRPSASRTSTHRPPHRRLSHEGMDGDAAGGQYFCRAAPPRPARRHRQGAR